MNVAATSAAPAAPAAAVVTINGPALREIRIRTGVEVAGLAAEVGVGRPYIAQLELGQRQRCSARVFDELCRALRITDRRALLADPYQQQSS